MAEKETVRLTPITIAEAWQMAVNNNLMLQAKNQEVKMAHANLRQERLWDNPEVSISHNVNNPVTHRYFELGKEGETDVQLSQRIYIGGQRGERGRKATADLHRTECERDDNERLLRRSLCGTMVTLQSLHQKLEVIDKELSSISKIMQAYKNQVDKGNVTPADLVRMRSQHMQLLQERALVVQEEIEQDQQLRLMIGNPLAEGQTTLLTPTISYDDNVAHLDSIDKKAIVVRLANRADMRADAHDVTSALHEVRLQKANSLPELNLTGEWDKNGNIGHNYFGVGVSVTLPLFNRNQGGRKMASAQLEAKRIEQEQNKREALSEIDVAWRKLTYSRQMASHMAQHVEQESDRMMAEMEQQYMKRNVSLLELLDYYQTYKANCFLLIETKRDVLLSMQELDIEMK